MCALALAAVSGSAGVHRSTVPGEEQGPGYSGGYRKAVCDCPASFPLDAPLTGTERCPAWVSATLSWRCASPIPGTAHA